MPTRHLTDDQRRRFASFDGDPSPEQLNRHFHLDRFDHEVIRSLRGGHNRLGFAVLLCSARFLGTFPNERDDIPKTVLMTLGRQLGLGDEMSLDGYFGNSAQKRHLTLIRERFGFTDFSDNGFGRFRLTRWLYSLCWSGDDQPGVLIDPRCGLAHCQ